MNQDEKYMKEAIRQAKKAYALKEVPIGCVIVYQDKIIARGYNRRTIDKNTLAHAELIAIRKASRKMDDWRLEECTMYVTLEPCQMCSGAIVQSRMKKVVVGCMNPKAGCAGSIFNLLQVPQFNHQVELEIGVLEEECSQLMKSFFRELREEKARKRRKTPWNKRAICGKESKKTEGTWITFQCLLFFKNYNASEPIGSQGSRRIGSDSYSLTNCSGRYFLLTTTWYIYSLNHVSLMT